MTHAKLKRLAEAQITEFGRAFDDPQSRCLTSEAIAVNPAFSFCQGSLADNIEYFRDSGLIDNDLVFDVVDNSTFNACASTSNGHEVIAINSGIFITLVALYYKLLSFRTVFPWVGQPGLESQNVDPLPRLPDSFQNDAQLFLSMILSAADRAKFLKSVSQDDIGIEEPVGFEWANSCSKPYLDAY